MLLKVALGKQFALGRIRAKRNVALGSKLALGKKSCSEELNVAQCCSGEAICSGENHVRSCSGEKKKIVKFEKN
ncbi:MAG: hypothetical protein KBC30_08260 [Planctomycetes bacterium]|nr:hypothetical protein [Planctomycetota bacterium]HPY74833.1 hypothetical protein [Planctomycetota bacterium]HQB01537.1 hypothetical protein [Planctomycetota bacterium]